MDHHAVLIASNNPSVHDFEEIFSAEYRLPQFGIDDVRALIATAYRRPPGADSIQALLVATEFITEEAQQALLKIIEEPPLSTRFVFVIPEGYQLLPTLESRFERREHISQNSKDLSLWYEFKKANHQVRLILIEQSTKNKDHVWQKEIKSGLYTFLLGRAEKLTLTELKELEYVARLLLTRGASNKFLLEHLALTLPLEI